VSWLTHLPAHHRVSDVVRIQPVAEGCSHRSEVSIACGDLQFGLAEQETAKGDERHQDEQSDQGNPQAAPATTHAPYTALSVAQHTRRQLVMRYRDPAVSATRTGGRPLPETRL